MILFVTGIDTGIGKTIATGVLAAGYAARGARVITQKLAQTGCEGFPEDLLTHRRLMGSERLPEDDSGLTCPYVFRFPASPHLAAALEQRRVELTRLAGAAAELARRCDVLLVEGVGGLCVPLTPEATVLDFVAGQAWPVVLVTSSRLGSINHTLLSLDALRARGLPLAAVIYNTFPPQPPEIEADTRAVIVAALARAGSRAPVLDLGKVDPVGPAVCEWAALPV